MDLIPARCSKGKSFKQIWPPAKPIVGESRMVKMQAADDVASLMFLRGRVEREECFEFQCSLQISGEGEVFWVPI